MDPHGNYKNNERCGGSARAADLGWSMFNLVVYIYFGTGVQLGSEP